ncbi:MAG: DNA repair protein RecO [Verrucomicrobia bacterium]|nr:DNA repair protein RecO [Cytophagales bacterium]
MLQKTRGIVINYIKFGETSIITKIYTEELGLQTYIENSVRTSKGKNKIALFQPLTLLDLVVYYNENQSIKRISEIRCHTQLTSIPFEFRKSTVGIFMGEILNKTLKEETGNEKMFEFLFSSVQWLDLVPDKFENFHIQFLLKLARFLGFDPQSGREIFNQTGRLAPDDNEEIQKIDFLIQNPYDNHLKINATLRRELLDTVLKFYAFQIENFGEVKSLAVLQELMN